MADQAKAEVPAGGTGGFERALQWAGVIAFVVFSLWSGWRFLTYQDADASSARYFLDPASYPNSLRVQFTLGEYLETFGPWRGFAEMPWMAWLAAVVLIALGPAFSFMMLQMRKVRETWPLLLALVPGIVLLTVLFPSPISLPGDQWARFAVLIIPMVVLFKIGERPRGSPSHPLRALLRWICLVRTPLAVGAPLLILLLLAFLSTTTPAVQSDGLRYHQAAGEIWRRTGWGAPIEGMAFSHFPFLISSQYQAGEIEGKVIHFAWLLVSLALMAGFVRLLSKWGGIPPRCRRSVALLAIAVVTTTPAFTIISTWSFSDAGVVCFHLAAIFAMAVWWHLGKPSYLILAGALTGLMLGTKYTALIPATVLGLGVLAHRRSALRERCHTPWEQVKHATIFAVIALALASPWYIRNWVQTGNPVYPLANELFQAPGWPPESQALWEEKAAEKGVPKMWTNLLEAWRAATFKWQGGKGVGPGGFEDQSIGLAPWLLAPLGLSGLALLAVRNGGWWRFHALFVGVNYLLWFFTYQSNRLLLTTVIVALPACVVGLAHLTRRWRSMWTACLIAFGVACTYQGLWIARYFLVEQYPLQLTLGFMDPDAWRSARLNHFDGTRVIRKLVPEDEHVLVIGESRRFYFPPNAVMSDWFDPPAVGKYLVRSTAPDELSAALRSEGITHVFINHAELLPRAERQFVFRRAVLRGDGTIDEAVWWNRFRDLGAMPEGSNIHYLRRRLGDAKAKLLADWLTSVPHEVVWHGEQPHTAGVELWRLTGSSDAPQPG